MKHRSLKLACALALATALGMQPALSASLGDTVKGAMGASSGGSSLGTLGGVAGVPAMDSVGLGNLAGVLGYCIQHKYVDGGANAVKERLLGKLGGESQATQDPGYQQGLGGTLMGRDGQKLDLSGDGLKKKMTDKVCDQVLEHGQSLL